MTQNTDVSDTSTGISVVLSREELLAILHLLEVSSIPGLGVEPISNISPEQQAFALIVAERALRARGLATINPEGRLLIYADVLRMISACILPAQSLHITKIAMPDAIALQLMAHQRDGAWALHVVTDPVLHAFYSSNSWQNTLEQILAYCQWPAKTSSSNLTIETTNETLNQVQDLVVNNEIKEAEGLLLSGGNELNAVRELLQLLSKPHYITVIQRVVTKTIEATSIQSITVLHNDNELLVAVHPAMENNNEQIAILSTSTEMLKRRISEITHMTA